MNHFGDFLDVVEKLITVIGAIVAAGGVWVPKVRAWLDQRGEQARHSRVATTGARTGGATASPSGSAVANAEPTGGDAKVPRFRARLKHRLAARHGVVELAFALILAAAFTVLFSNALFQGANADTDPLRAFLKTLVLAIVLVVLLGAAWYQRQLEFATGTLSVTAMLILLLATHESWQHAGGDLDSGDTLLLTLLGLLMLATGTLTFLFGNPLASGRERGHAVLWTFGVVAVVGIAATLVGRQKVRLLAHNPKVPSVYSPAVDKFAKAVSELPLESRRLTYQLSSEMALAETYQSDHDAVEEQYRVDHAGMLAARSAASFSRAAPSPDPSAPPSHSDAEAGDSRKEPTREAGTEAPVGDYSLEALQKLQLAELQRDLELSQVQRFKR